MGCGQVVGRSVVSEQRLVAMERLWGGNTQEKKG